MREYECKDNKIYFYTDEDVNKYNELFSTISVGLVELVKLYTELPAQ